MRTFSSRERMSSRRNFRRQKNIVYGIVVTVVLLFVLFFADAVVGSFTSRITTPIKEAKLWVQDVGKNVFSYTQSREDLARERVRLQEELAAEGSEQEIIRNLRLENEELRLLLNTESPERVAAGVIMRPNETPYDTLLIDRGSRHGIQENAVVYTADDFAIGFVHKVFPTSSLVALVTTPGITSTAYILGPDIYTQAEGMGGGALVVSVPQGITLAVDDLVVLPSIDGGIFGSVSHIEAFESSPEQYGFVTSPIPLSSIRFVSVSATPLANVSFEMAENIVRDLKTELLVVDVPKEVLISTSTATTTSPDQGNDDEI